MSSRLILEVIIQVRVLRALLWKWWAAVRSPAPPRQFALVHRQSTRYIRHRLLVLSVLCATCHRNLPLRLDLQFVVRCPGMKYQGGDDHNVAVTGNLFSDAYLTALVITGLVTASAICHYVGTLHREVRCLQSEA